MRLLDRYLFRELFTPLAYCFIGIQAFLICIVVFTDAGKIGDAKLSFGQTIEYAAASTMENLWIVIPVCLLLALLMTITHHARHNEITAMRAAGISLWRICLPYFIVGLFASAILFVLDETIVPRCADWAYRTINRNNPSASGLKDVYNFPFINGRANRNWVIRGYYHPGAPELPHPLVRWSLADGSSRILSADKTVRTNGVWIFYNANEFSQADAASLAVPMWQTNVAALTMPDFDETPEEIKREIKIAGYFSGRNGNLSLADIRDYMKWHPNLSKEDRGWLLTEMHGRIATPLTCLVVVLIAIPFGAAPGRRNLFFGVAGSIFICFTFFVLQRASFAFGSSGACPAWLAAWLPNMIFAILGLILMMRIR
jgi:lipopolysaccharide export system permease protein